MDVYDASTGIDVLVSKSTFTYDLGGEFRVATNPSNDSVTQHDPAYDSNFSYRGNISKAFRYDVGDPTNQNNTAAQTESGYNSSGSLVFERRLHKASPAVWHQTTIGYVDSFSVVGNNGNTFAYPTTVTDPDGFQSFVKYNFDFGGVTEKQTPSPNAGQTAPKQLITYDSLGRVSQLTNNINGAYVRHVYGATYVQSYSTVNTAADEAYSISFFDGAGREYYSASNHPGSTGGYKAVSTKYDVMGRVWKVSNPTEVNGSSLPTGDDAGWFYTTQTYDWKSRPLATTNTDGSTRTASYGGCGCAGGEVVTLTDEVNRRQKFSTDFLGRQWKAEVLNTDSTVYSTSVSVFNVRDQVTNVKQYDGAAPGDASSTNAAASCPNPSATCQETKMTYDGHGRLQTKHLPEQNLGAATVYAYNLDDTLYSSTDARTAATTYGYNGRHLVTSVVTTLPGLSTIAVTHGYDGASNRTSMSHLVGGVAKDSASSSYDQLSRLTSETRHINALEGYSPNYGNFTMGYGYTLSNALQSVTDPFNSTTTLSYDVAGRTASVTGSFSGTNYTYANNVVYRAWGGVKSASVGGVAETVSYNSRLQPREFRSYQMRYDYSYFDDGKLKGIKDLDDQIGDPHEVQFHYMSRAYSYDQSGRV
ncbi:MAG: hypothetical protein ND895_13985, partial [Pyrinomonadaceae bacterium]|nr:hypothetical protein [Pyrinomonadaceae bacterium]